MAVQVTVTINFEAKTAKEAQTLISTWVLHKGDVRIYTNISEPVNPHGTDDEGNVVPVEEATAK